MSRKANEIVKGEELNVVIGSRPFKDDEVSEKIKLNLLNILLKSTALLKEIFFLPSLSLCRHFRLTISALTEV